MIRRVVIYVALGVCLAVFLVQAVTVVGLQEAVGLTRENWDGRTGVGFHGKWGAVIYRRGMYFFVEHEERVIQSPFGRWARWEGAGAAKITTGEWVLRDWSVLGIGYRSSWSGFTYWSGDYHLVRVNSLLVLLVSGMGMIWSWREMRGVGRRRMAQGCCVACGYDLRSGHEVCPECGVAVETKAGE